MTRVTIAAAQYPIDAVTSFADWQAKLARWVADAAGQGAQLLVFPEYASMELAAVDPASAGDLHASLETVIALGPQVDAHHSTLAQHYGVMILAGSIPHRLDDGRIVNRARLFLPDGQSAYQDKIVMTRFEREKWGISGGDALHVIETPIGLVGISICYDSEFPLIARAMAEAGARLILVPSATDTLQGYWRVRIGAQARALENQCVVVQAPTVGEALWSPALDENFGAAGVYGPPDAEVPDDGVLALGEPGRPMWLIAAVDLDRVDAWRQDGAVRPYRHWPEQYCGTPAILPPVRTVAMR